MRTRSQIGTAFDAETGKSSARGGTRSTRHRNVRACARKFTTSRESLARTSLASGSRVGFHNTTMAMVATAIPSVAPTRGVQGQLAQALDVIRTAANASSSAARMPNVVRQSRRGRLPELITPTARKAMAIARIRGTPSIALGDWQRAHSRRQLLGQSRRSTAG